MSRHRWLAVVALLSVHVSCLPIDRWPINTVPQPSTKEFDLGSPSTDLNGFLLNPMWASQTSNPSGPPVSAACEGAPERVFRDSACTGQRVRFDKAKLPTLAFCAMASAFPGHVNWAPATLTGTAHWLTWATPWDNDVNFYFVPHDGVSGLARGNERMENQETPYIELEFTSDETLAYFSTVWWTDLWERAQHWADTQEPDTPIRQWLNPDHPDEGQRAVVVGLFGLDCEHGCKSEVHPVFALALETKRSATSSTWAIFARNFGTEGFCASRLHYLMLPSQTLRLSLPGPGALGQRVPVRATIVDYATSYAAETPDPIIESNGADGSIVVSFTLPDPDIQPLSELVVRLDWELLETDKSVPLKPGPTLQEPAAARMARLGAEGRLNAILRSEKEPSARTALLVAGRRKVSISPGPVKTTRKTAPPPFTIGVFGATMIRRASSPVTTKQKPDVGTWLAQRQRSQRVMLRNLCEQYKQQLPNFSQEQSRRVCANVLK